MGWSPAGKNWDPSILVTRKRGVASSYFEFAAQGLIREAEVVGGRTREGVAFRASILESPKGFAIQAGVRMEHTVAELEKATRAVEAAKAELQKIYNEFTVMHEAVMGSISASIEPIRSHRMATVEEVHKMLTTLRDLRAFFLDERHAEEMVRLERLAALCRQLGDLKRDGTLDAVCDSALRLAVGERS